MLWAPPRFHAARWYSARTPRPGFETAEVPAGGSAGSVVSFFPHALSTAIRHSVKKQGNDFGSIDFIEIKQIQAARKPAAAKEISF